VEEILRKSGVKEGMMLVSAMHITAGVYVNDNESGLIEDIDHVRITNIITRVKTTATRRSNSAQSASSAEVAGSSWVGRVAAIRNLAGLRFSATARYQDRPSRIAPDSQSRQVAHGGGSLPLGLLP